MSERLADEPTASTGGPRGWSRRRIGLVVLVALALAGGAVLVLGPGDDAPAGDVVLLPAGSAGPDAFTDDLDLLAAGERAGQSGSPPQLESLQDVKEPVVLAGATVRGAEAGLYTAARDEPTCDVDQLNGLLTGDAADPAAATAWFTAVSRQIDEDERDDYLDDLTAVRLRFDTRVTAHRFDAGTFAAYPAVLQAGTGILVDGLGVPRVRCAGGSPLGEPQLASSNLTRDHALDVDARASNPEDAWDGFDPARVVVVEGRPIDDALEIAAAGADETFERRIGSNGDRDRGVFTPTRDPGCQADCHELEIAVTDVQGSAVSLTFEGVVDPDSDSTELSLHWGRTSPTTFRYSLLREWRTYRTLAPGDDLDAIYQAFFNDPAHDGDELQMTPDSTAMVWCEQGPVTITVTVDGAVDRTTAEDVPCTTGSDLEYVLG